MPQPQSLTITFSRKFWIGCFVYLVVMFVGGYAYGRWLATKLFDIDDYPDIEPLKTVADYIHEGLDEIEDNTAVPFEGVVSDLFGSSTQVIDDEPF